MNIFTLSFFFTASGCNALHNLTGAHGWPKNSLPYHTYSITAECMRVQSMCAAASVGVCFPTQRPKQPRVTFLCNATSLWRANECRLPASQPAACYLPERTLPLRNGAYATGCSALLCCLHNVGRCRRWLRRARCVSLVTRQALRCCNSRLTQLREQASALAPPRSPLFSKCNRREENMIFFLCIDGCEGLSSNTMKGGKEKFFMCQPSGRESLSAIIRTAES